MAIQITTKFLSTPSHVLPSPGPPSPTLSSLLQSQWPYFRFSDILAHATQPLMVHIGTFFWHQSLQSQLCIKTNLLVTYKILLIFAYYRPQIPYLQHWDQINPCKPKVYLQFFLGVKDLNWPHLAAKFDMNGWVELALQKITKDRGNKSASKMRNISFCCLGEPGAPVRFS